jgi:hypothetical protein
VKELTLRQSLNQVPILLRSHVATPRIYFNAWRGQVNLQLGHHWWTMTYMPYRGR